MLDFFVDCANLVIISNKLPRMRQIFYKDDCPSRLRREVHESLIPLLTHRECCKTNAWNKNRALREKLSPNFAAMKV